MAKRYTSFKSLDKSRFPSAKEKKRKKRRPEPAPPEEPRVLSDEDAFVEAMSGVQPLDAKTTRVAARPPKQSLRAAGDEDLDVQSHLLDLVSGKVEFTLEFTNEFIQGRVSNLDIGVMSKLKAGRYSPEAHLDLHGMTAREAYDAMVHFVREHYLQNRRCILLIPGRGKNSPDGYGVLRQKVQSWLTRDPFKRVVLAFCTALPKHGGAGALYVLLRSQKKAGGKIFWNRAPDDVDLY